MGFEYRLDTERNFIFVQFSGTINNQQLSSAFATVYADPLYSPVMNQIINYSEVSRWQVDRQGIEELAQRIARFNDHGTPWLTAIVAPDDLLYGYARMYQMLNDDRYERIIITRSLDEVLKSVLLDEDSYPFQVGEVDEQGEY